MEHGAIPNFVERNPARYNQTMREAATHRFLADPIEFAQNMARILETGLLEDLLIQDEPRQVQDFREEYEFMIDTAIRRKDVHVVEELLAEYHGFVTSALNDAREYGVALGAVMEQLRVGLAGVVDLRNRGLTFGDVQVKNDLQSLRRKHGLPRSGAQNEADVPRAEAKDAA